jgi:hypothetical protein
MRSKQGCDKDEWVEIKKKFDRIAKGVFPF